MTKLEALKACVWLECIVESGNRSNIFEREEAIKKIRGIQSMLARLPDEAEE
ncbi:hypothetical protein [Caproiciproducens sp. NJN-50]|uniref:hypothetical protein n=1 Tax=Caproiciproducens sp. NJN-50 TaxID=2507162 RepID=UPI0013E8B296|nr:hypothetical protein [Caproiciproducens sp. NJN-50]